VHDLIAQAAYGNHPLGMPILGTEENLLRMTADDLRRFMNDQYGLDGIVLSAAGNIDESLIELLEKHFGGMKRKLNRQAAEAPALSPGHMFMRKKTEQNHICLAMPGVSQNDPKLYAMMLLNNYIGGGMSSRLFQDIREERGLAYSIYSYHSAYLDSGLFTIYAGTSPKQTEEVLHLIQSIIDDVKAKGMSEEELRKGKEQMKGNLILGLESTSSRMSRNGRNELLHGRQITLDEMIERIEAVTLDDIRAVVSHLFGGPCATAMVGHSDKVLLKWREKHAAVV
jgi:predicted Zn-dependent peptidase